MVRRHDKRSSALFGVTAVCSFLVVLCAAQIAVLYATLYSFTGDPSGVSPVPVWLPSLVFVAVVGAGAVVVLWRAHRDRWAAVPATLTASGLVLLGFAALTTTGVCQTGSLATVGRPLASLSVEWRFTWVLGPATPALEASSAGGSCQAHLRAIPLVVGYPLVGAGLFVRGWLETRLAAVASTLETRLGAWR